MVWWRPLGRADPPGREAKAGRANPGRANPAVERAAPGIAAFFAGVALDGSHAVLDLGPASEGSLRVYGRYASRVRFADLLPGPPSGQDWDEALKRVPRDHEGAYDLVVAWNVLDRMAPEQRPSAVRRLTELTGPGARLYIVMDASPEPTIHPLRFTLLEDDRIRQEATGPCHRAWPKALPAEVERLLQPFVVEHAFVLRQGMREYMAVRGEGRSSD